MDAANNRRLRSPDRPRRVRARVDSDESISQMADLALQDFIGPLPPVMPPVMPPVVPEIPAFHLASDLPLAVDLPAVMPIPAIDLVSVPSVVNISPPVVTVTTVTRQVEMLRQKATRNQIDLWVATMIHPTSQHNFLEYIDPSMMLLIGIKIRLYQSSNKVPPEEIVP